MFSQSEALLKTYRAIVCIRFVEEIEENFVKQGKAFFYMPSSGHEGCAALSASLIPEDYLACHYRDKALMIARGARPLDFFRNMFCTADSDSAGRQMSAFLHSRKLNMISLSGPVTNSALHACGAAAELTAGKKKTKNNAIVYCGLGDGMTQEGEFYEAVLFAAAECLPVLFVVEDNGYAISTKTAGKTFFSSPAGEESSFCGVPIEYIDGLNPAAAQADFAAVVNRIRERSQKNEGIVPALVVMKTERLSNHTNSDDQSVYRSAEELQAAAKKDPLAALEKSLLEGGITAEKLAEIRAEEQKSVLDDLKEAENGKEPEACFDAKKSADFESISAQTFQLGTLWLSRSEEKNTFTVNEAINAVLFNRLESDPRVSLFGEDIEDPKGDVFGVTRGLSSAFPGRVRNSPLAESTIAGVSAGRALAGGKPVAFFQFADFMPVAMNQLFSEIGNMYWRTAGAWETPVLFMVSCGAYRPGLGPFHASTLESMILQIPGIDVCMPSNAADAAGLLNTAFESRRPTVFFYPKNCLNDRSLSCTKEDLSRALNPYKLRRIEEGTDITLAGWGNAVGLLKTAAGILRKNGKTADLIDLASLSPWDEQGLISSVKKTRNLLVVQENNRTCGFASEVAATVSDYFSRNSPQNMPRIRRLSRPDTYVPFQYANQLEVLPSASAVTEEAVRMLGGQLVWNQETDDQLNGNTVIPAAGSSPSDELITVVEWLVKAGDRIEQGQIIANMEADKASFEFASPAAGKIAEFFAATGDTIEVGKPLFSLKNESGSNSTPNAPRTREVIKEALINWSKTEVFLPSAASGTNKKLKIGIAGISIALPSKRVSTEELEQRYGWRDVEKKNGIKQRYWADETEDASVLGFRAAKQILEKLNLSVFDLDLIICATGSPVSVSPSLACHILSRLSETESGSKKASAGAYDISAACSGYIYGLQAAWDFLNSKPNSKVLLVTSEVLSKQTDKTDVGTAPVFGDAASATVLSTSLNFPLEAVLLRPETSSAAEDGTILRIPRDIREPIFMNGPAVFLAAVREMGEILKKSCTVHGIPLEALDLVIPHQANQRILNAVRQKLHLKPEQVFSNISDYGNTSSSSIPIALSQVFEAGTRGTLALCSFGAGFVFGSCLLQR